MRDRAATLYVTDLDGTLIRDDLSMSPWARETLVAMLRDGLPLTIATARSIVSLAAILGDVPLALPVVEFGGAFLTDYATRRHLSVKAIQADACRAIRGAITGRGLCPFLSTYDGDRDWLFYTSLTNDGERAYYQERLQLKDDRLRRVQDLGPALRQHVVCFTLIGKEEELSALGKDLGSRFPLQVTMYAARYSPGWHFLSLHAAGATKEAGIAALRERTGMGDARLVVFGDDVNDLGMLRAADHAVAVANARPEVREIAHEVIGSNQEDSVVRWLRESFRGNGRGGA